MVLKYKRVNTQKAFRTVLGCRQNYPQSSVMNVQEKSRYFLVSLGEDESYLGQREHQKWQICCLLEKNCYFLAPVEATRGVFAAIPCQLWPWADL